MFTIRECESSETFLPICRAFGADADEYDRVFIFDEGGPKGVAILSLRRGTVVFRGVYGELDAAYRDVMTRAVLNACTYMKPIRVRVDEVSDYYRQFGFAEADGGMEAVNTDIVFR